MDMTPKHQHRTGGKPRLEPDRLVETIHVSMSRAALNKLDQIRERREDARGRPSRSAMLRVLIEEADLRRHRSA